MSIITYLFDQLGYFSFKDILEFINSLANLEPRLSSIGPIILCDIYIQLIILLNFHVKRQKGNTKVHRKNIFAFNRTATVYVTIRAQSVVKFDI